MPLLDHFRPPVSQRVPWTTIHAAWASKLVDNLNERWLPEGFIAGERIGSGNHPAVDFVTWESPELPAAAPAHNGAATAVAAPAAVNAVPAPDHTAELRPDLGLTTEVLIKDENGTLVAVVEFVSPSNKDRPRERNAFAGKVAAYVMGGVCVAVVDVATVRRSNLHDHICEMLELPEEIRSESRGLYAVCYRPKSIYQPDSGRRKLSVDVWWRDLTVGAAIPTLPLRLTGDTFVPLELEATYIETCRMRRLT